MNKDNRSKKKGKKGGKFRSKDKTKPFKNTTPWGSTPESNLSSNKALCSFLSNLDKIGHNTPLHKAKQTLRELTIVIVEAYLGHLKTSASTDTSMIAGSTGQTMLLSRIHMIVKEFPVKTDTLHTAAFYDAQSSRGRKIVEHTDVSSDDPLDILNALHENKVEKQSTLLVTAKDRFALLKARCKELGLTSDAAASYVKIIESLSKQYSYYLRAVITKPIASKLDAVNSQIKPEEGDALRYLRLEKALLAMLRDTDSEDLMRTILTSSRGPKETLPETFVRIVTAHDKLRRLLEDYEWDSPRADWPDSISFRTVWSRLHDLASKKERAILLCHGHGLPSTEEERTKRCRGQENWAQLIKDISSLEIEWSSFIHKKSHSKDRGNDKRPSKSNKESNRAGNNGGTSATDSTKKERKNPTSKTKGKSPDLMLCSAPRLGPSARRVYSSARRMRERTSSITLMHSARQISPLEPDPDR